MMIMTSKLICIFGMSGSGKTHLSNRIESLLSYPAIHCIGHIKRYYERIYNLPIGSLDTPEGKNHIAPGAKSSVGECIVQLYHFWQEHDPAYSTRGLKQIIIDLVESDTSFTLNGIRNMEEGVMINELKSKYKSSLEVYKIWIESDLSNPLTTDALQEDIYQRIIEDKQFELFNDMTFNCFDQFIKERLV